MLEELRNALEENNQSEERPKICPKCGSTRFHYELARAGSHSNTSGMNSRTTSFSSYSHRSTDSYMRYRSIGVCPECGYTTEEDRYKITPKGVLTAALTIVIGIVVFAGLWWIFKWKVGLL